MRKLLVSLLLAASALACAQLTPPVPSWPLLTGLPQWNRALSAVRAGTGNARIVCVGDSITRGYGAATTSSYTGAQPYSYPHVLCGLLSAALGVTVQDDNFTGDGCVGANSSTLQLYDPRISNGSGWVTNSSAVSGFGGSFINSGSTTNKISFTPVGSFDTIEISYGTASGAGSFTTDIGSSSLGTINCNASSGIARQTFTVALGTHTINFTPTSGAASSYIASVVCYNSAIHQVIVLNAGFAGATSAGIVDTANAPFNLQGYYALANPPDLTLFMVGTNDANTSVALATYLSNLETSTNQMQAWGGDTLFLSWPQPENTSVTTAINAGYRFQMQQVAGGHYPLCDVAGYLGLWATANANGFMSDNFHPSQAGYAKIASLINKYILGS